MDSYTSYLTYSDYKELGGTLPEDAFRLLERKAHRYMDEFTFKRIPQLDHIPDEVREVMKEFIDKLNTVDNQRESGDLITQYSNGVEQLTYKIITEEELKSDLNKLAVSWLPNYLTYRGVNFDVKEYLQSNSNRPQ